LLAAARSFDPHGIVCTAGGWQGGDAASAAFVASWEAMLHACLQPALLAAAVASTLPQPGTTLVLVGSAASVKPTPGMLAYGVAKAATHHIVRSVGDAGSALSKSGGRAFAILPHTIDTPSNRKHLQYNRSWIPVSHLAYDILELVATGAGRRASVAGTAFESGTLLESRTTANMSSLRVMAA